MDMTIFETGKGAQLLEYLQSQGMAVVIWNQTVSPNQETYRAVAEMGGTNLVQNHQKTLQERIAEELVRMGFRRGQVGFNNIVTAITLIVNIEHGKPIRVTGDIYPKVAERYGNSVCSVERTIRNAIESVWKRSNLRTLEQLYPFPCDNLNGRPTNAEFLINMAGKFRT